jgi:hypothetical protein
MPSPFVAESFRVWHTSKMVSGTERQRLRDEDVFADVPPSVVCAVCGHATCLGCTPVGEDGRVASAVVSVVRLPDDSLQGLLVAATSQPALFVRAMDRRALPEVLGFALLCELAAALQVTAFIAAALRVLLGPVAIARLAVATSVATLVLTAVLVAGHALWGLAVHRAERARACRFGLATCAWDLALSPVGLLVMAPRVGTDLFALVRRASVGLPAATSGAFLDHVGVDDPEDRQRARRRALVAAVVGTIAGAFVAIAALGGIVLAWWV